MVRAVFRVGVPQCALVKFFHSVYIEASGVRHDRSDDVLHFSRLREVVKHIGVECEDIALSVGVGTAPIQPVYPVLVRGVTAGRRWTCCVW